MAPVADLPVDDALAVPVDADASVTLVQDEAQAEHIHKFVLVDRFDGDANIG